MRNWSIKKTISAKLHAPGVNATLRGRDARPSFSERVYQVPPLSPEFESHAGILFSLLDDAGM